jgi:hypothetical protein
MTYLIQLFKSKTIWFNVLVAGLAALEPVFGALQSFLPGNVYAYLTVGLAVGNAVLRVVTSQAISDK